MASTILSFVLLLTCVAFDSAILFRKSGGQDEPLCEKEVKVKISKRLIRKYAEEFRPKVDAKLAFLDTSTQNHVIKHGTIASDDANDGIINALRYQLELKRKTSSNKDPWLCTIVFVENVKVYAHNPYRWQIRAGKSPKEACKASFIAFLDDL